MSFDTKKKQISKWNWLAKKIYEIRLIDGNIYQQHTNINVHLNDF